jgi:hypothetical protein
MRGLVAVIMNGHRSTDKMLLCFIKDIINPECAEKQPQSSAKPCNKCLLCKDTRRRENPVKSEYHRLVDLLYFYKWKSILLWPEDI